MRQQGRDGDEEQGISEPSDGQQQVESVAEEGEGAQQRENAAADIPPRPEGAPMFRGFATISFYADDLAPLTTRDLGFTTASVIDPFGNILGVMHNPHYLEVLARRSAS